MNGVVGIGLLVCSVHGFQDAWPDAVIDIAKRTFNRPVVLYLDSPDYHPRRRTLLPSRDFSKRDRVLSVLASEFALLIADRNYTRPDEDAIRYKLALINAGQIIAFLGKNSASDSITLQTTIQLWRTNAVWFSRAKILIIIETKMNGQLLAESVISELWRQVKSANVLVLTAWGKDVQFFSFVPYDPSCRVTVQSVGAWNTTHRHYNAYPTWAFRNLNNCTLRVTATELVPYVFPPDTNGNYNDGVDIQLFNYLSHILNFSYEFVKVRPGENPWLSLINGTPSGFIGVLYRGEADIALTGARLNYERCFFVDHLDPYISDDFTWIGPAAQRTARWKAVFLVFPLNLWLGIVTAFLTSLLLVSFIYSKNLKNATSTAFLVIWAASLNSSVPTVLITSSLKTFFCFYLFYTLTVNALYTSALYGVLTNGLKLQTIDSHDEAANLGLTATIFPSNIPDLKETVPDYYQKITQNNLVIWTNQYMDCLNRAARQGDCYLLFTALGARYEINLRFTTKSGRAYVRIMKNRYKNYDPTIYLQRHHPLFLILRKRVRQLTENGWVKMKIANIMTESIRQRLENSQVKDLSEQEERKTLSLEQILGVFLITGLIMISAIITFICEIMINRTQIKGKSFKLTWKSSTN